MADDDAGPVVRAGSTGESAVGLRTDHMSSRLLGTEIVIVVAIAIGVAASRSVLRFVSAITAPAPLSSQVATLNASQAPGRPWIDLGLQLVFVLSLLLPVALVLYLVKRSGDQPSTIGLRLDRLGSQVALGALAAAVIGGIGLVAYLGARSLDASLTLVPTTLPPVWWRIPVLVLASVANALLEEVVLIGYLGSRLRALGWSPAGIVATSALLRGLYHLYQGVSGFLGNLVMGAIFATYFQRTGRVVALIVAHALVDIVAFVGYVLLAPHVSWL